MDYDSILLNDNEPLIKKAMLIEDNASYGRLLGTLKTDYLYLVKGNIIYIQYTRELLQYMLVISTYINRPNKLEPVITKSFKSIKDLKKYLSNIIKLIDKDMIVKELCEEEEFSVFD